MRLTRICFLLVVILSLNAHANTKIYKSVNEQGTPVFSDQPQQGAQPVDLPPISTFEADDIEKLPQDNEPADLTDNPQKYTSLSIIQPQGDTSIWLGAGELITVVDLQPPLSNGDKIQILLDGTMINESDSETKFVNNNIDRGQHQVQAQVIDTEGNVLITSDPVTFNMHRSSALQKGG